MNSPIPNIQKYMTTSPHAVGSDQPLSLAHELMQKHGVRHLPVLSGGALVGMLSDRDLRLIETLKDVDPKQVAVEEAMSTQVYSVSPEAPLDEVLDDMAEHKYDCAVIMQNSRVIGIFTTVDVCRAFGELLRTRLAH